VVALGLSEAEPLRRRIEHALEPVALLEQPLLLLGTVGDLPGVQLEVVKLLGQALFQAVQDRS
jgi:hypothetical protein